MSDEKIVTALDKTCSFGFNDAAAIVSWAASEGPQFQAFMATLPAIQSAQSLDDRWDAVKASGDALLPILDTCPLLAATSDAARLPMSREVFDQHVEKVAKQFALSGTFLTLLLQNLPAIETFLATILPLFKK